MLFHLIYIIVAGMLLAVLQEMITLYGCEIIFIVYLQFNDYLILDLLKFVSCFFLFANYRIWYVCCYSTRNDCSI